MALRLSRAARREFDLDGVVGQGLSHTDWAACQRLAGRLNARRAGVTMVTPADLHALSVLDEAFRQVLRAWHQTHGDALTDAVDQLPAADDFAALWEVEFGGPVAVDALVTALHHANPAAAHVYDLVAWSETLGAHVANLESATQTLPPFQGVSLMTFLRQALQGGSLGDQVKWVLAHWSEFLDSALQQALLRSFDFYAETWRAAGGGPAETPSASSYAFDFVDADVERFSPDRDWMPNCVVIAKNIYVWLHQLSRKYGYTIDRLDQVPEAELAELGRRGINGLWMIGLWERSHASQRVKQMCGNPDAVASAYSLYDYRIAEALGGDGAWEALRSKAWRHGVRLAADMVPNHVGIVSEWVKHHPEWFVSLPESPFPNYTFHSEDLSDEPWLSIHVEDHYFDRTDAAVVFKRHDHRSGETRYIYHGNDGTTMPWNDTAQLDYLNPDVREAVIQTILQVARRFPIIRFDAAMTLVKQHVQRLWYPEPGTGGAIPSRAAHGLTKAEFNQRMPKEFWQEVVDRVAAEVPDTLLLAEAFWMLEGYFVRNLGMHRVYNSAFMNMLRDEKNDEYRHLMRKTMDADPQILKRYVNFMNNPDEDTAADQFGTGAKYFGVCVMMATMPGLPMFGHGQLEGFREKYGMDFRRPLHDESVDEGLLAHHENVIFPLLHKRALFSEVDHFVLYDFQGASGVDENVFAYSNRRDGQRALVVYNNRMGGTAGWVKNSPQGSLVDALALQAGALVRFQDLIGRRWYLRWTDDLRNDGLYVQLEGYDHAVFLDWEYVDVATYGELANALKGAGVHDLEHERIMERTRSVHEALESYVRAEGDWDAVRAAFAIHHIDIQEDAPELGADELVAVALVKLLRAVGGPHARIWFDAWRFVARHGLNEEDAALARAALSVDDTDPNAWLENVDVQAALDVHMFEGQRWYRAESFDAFVQHFGNWTDLPRAAFKSAVKILQESADGSYDFDALVEMVAAR